MTLPHDRGEIRSLTGLRGVAAVFVVLYHFVILHHDAGFSSRFIERGYLAVDLFFVMSGYVMCLSYARMFERGLSWGRYGEFLVKRLGRVYPLYLALLLFMLLMCGLGVVYSSALGAWDVVCNLLLVQSWGLSYAMVSPSWSISTEFAAYLIFPLLLLLIRRRTVAIATLLAFAALALVATRTTAEIHQILGGVPVRHGPLDVAGTSIYPLLRCFAGFALGMVAFRVVESGAVRPSRLWGRLGDAVAALVVLLLFVPDTDLLLVPAFTALVIALATQRCMTGRLLGNSVVHRLGTISYSIYLVHDPLRLTLEQPLRALFAAAHLPHAYTLSLFATQLAILPVAAATFVLIEKPGRDAVRNLFALRRPALVAEPSAP